MERINEKFATVPAANTSSGIVNLASDYSRASDTIKQCYETSPQSAIVERSCIVASDHVRPEDIKGPGIHDILTLEGRQNRLLKIEKEIEQRWEKAKKVFAPYAKKSTEQIAAEYDDLHKYRQELWYNCPDELNPSPNPDYVRAVIKNKNDTKTAKLHAFSYNCPDDSYNASTILIHGCHFIALREPRSQCLNEFFRLLINHEVPLLVRLNQKEDYFKRHNMYYWEKYLLNENDLSLIHPKVIHDDKIETGNPIYYFHTDEWEDDKGINVEELYHLVEKVRAIYEKIENKGPMACHCTGGVGRTGSFIAAYIIAKMLELLDPSEISIEEIVLKLSIQRPFMVAVPEQYALLYEFFDYYLEQKKK